MIAEENPAYGVTLGTAPATTTEPLPTAPQPQEAEYELIPFQSSKQYTLCLTLTLVAIISVHVY